jgi:uncharacterized small protein (DUF1192 family)
MATDEDARPIARAHAIGEDLSSLSIEDLQARIGALQAEIARLEAAIAAKSAHRDAAAKLFR